MEKTAKVNKIVTSMKLDPKVFFNEGSKCDRTSLVLALRIAYLY